jgi:hypothetical protein
MNAFVLFEQVKWILRSVKAGYKLGAQRGRIASIGTAEMSQARSEDERVVLCLILRMVFILSALGLRCSAAKQAARRWRAPLDAAFTMLNSAAIISRSAPNIFAGSG